MTEKVSENSVIYHNVRATLKALTIENVRLFKTLPQNYLIIIRTYYMTRPGTNINYCSDRNISWYIRMPKSKHLNYHTELSENSDKWLSMLLLNLLPFICTIMKDYSDKLKSGLIECTKNLVQSLTSKWISVV